MSHEPHRGVREDEEQAIRLHAHRHWAPDFLPGPWLVRVRVERVCALYTRPSVERVSGRVVMVVIVRE
ncbi:MAG: hypothetical protein ACPIOQ_84115, partial [Promethearchaeia archaeon]